MLETSAAQTNGGGPTLPGETAVWAVLVETVELSADGEDGADVSRVWFEQVGYVTVPKRTQRETVLKKLLDGQMADGEGGDVPQIPMHAGEKGAVHLVPAELLGEAVPVRARATVLFEVIA